MHCKNCDYPLWNLKARQCPECGSPFTPSEFDFVLNSVRFCCPHCGQAYYGTGPRGHLVPQAFACVTCAKPVHMDDMVLLPAEGVSELQTKPSEMPWINRGNRGWIRAWLATVGMAMVRPGAMMRAVPLESALLRAWVFCIITQLLIAVVSTVPVMVFFAAIFLIAANAGGGQGGGGTLAPMFGLASCFGGLGVAFILGAVLWGLITHAVLRITGATRASIGRTFQAICYSSGANVVTATPCVGGYFGWIWWIVSAILAVKESQQVSGGRAALAVLVLPVLTIVAVGALYAVLIVGAISSARSQAAIIAAQGGSIAPAAEVQPLASGLVDYTQKHGQWPDHATRLMLEDNTAIASTDFQLLATQTDGSIVPVGYAKLYDLDFAQKQQLEDIVESAARALPADVVAHRVGDFVFTYHGVDPGVAGKWAGQGGGLWVLIAWPDPDANAPLATQSVAAATANGLIQQLPMPMFDAMLAAQNDLRADHGLPPLPHPSLVTHAKPATASKIDDLDSAGSGDSDSDGGEFDLDLDDESEP